MDLGTWLRSLGLERYEAAFRENEIDETVLPNLTQEDLKELGVGHCWAPPQAARCYRRSCAPTQAARRPPLMR